jgi:simple sugar transport system permease protein
MLGVLRAKQTPLPVPMLSFGKSKLFTAFNPELGFGSDMPIAVLLLVALVAVVFFIMRYTYLGRGIFAIGGDEVSAQRAGFNVFGTKVFLYSFVGMCAGIIGIVRVCLTLNCIPTDMLGSEMNVIAAVVLGGTVITGGKGTITGTILGISLITIVSNSLILLGIPTYWQQSFTGMIIILGTGLSLWNSKKTKKRLAA